MSLISNIVTRRSGFSAALRCTKPMIALMLAWLVSGVHYSDALPQSTPILRPTSGPANAQSPLLPPLHCLEHPHFNSPCPQTFSTSSASKSLTTSWIESLPPLLNETNCGSRGFPRSVLTKCRLRSIEVICGKCWDSSSPFPERLRSSSCKRMEGYELRMWPSPLPRALRQKRWSFFRKAEAQNLRLSPSRRLTKVGRNLPAWSRERRPQAG